MAATLQSLFPFTLNDAENFTVYPCYLKFSAPIISGKYLFSEATTPSQKFGKLLQNEKGIIAGIMLSANCQEQDFTSAIDNPLKLQILHDGNKTPVNLAPFPFANFSQTENFQLQWKASGASAKQEEYFRLSISGEVEQLPNMTRNYLELKIIFNYIRVGADKLDSVLNNNDIRNCIRLFADKLKG